MDSGHPFRTSAAFEADTNLAKIEAGRPLRRRQFSSIRFPVAAAMRYVYRRKAPSLRGFDPTVTSI
jgi:hypothetical protein